MEARNFRCLKMIGKLYAILYSKEKLRDELRKYPGDSLLPYDNFHIITTYCLLFSILIRVSGSYLKFH